MKTYRNSLERHNAPFRGVSSRSDFVNFHLAVAHDLLHVYNVSGGNIEIPGHKQINQDLLRAITEGGRDIQMADYSAGTIKKVTHVYEDLSNLDNWQIPAMTYGRVQQVGERAWQLTPPESERGFFELEHVLHVRPGEKLLIRFKTKDWNPNTVYQFGALNFDSGGHNLKRLEVDEFNTYTEINNRYFEHILRFDEERDVRLAIQSTNSQTGTLGEDPLTIEEFEIYGIEETEVYTRSLEEDIKPSVNASCLTIQHLEERGL